MVEVKYWETVTQRKKNEDALGIFRINIVPEEVPEISDELKGEERTKAIEQRNKKIDKAILDCKFKALDKVRSIVGHEGVLVANIIEESEEE